MVRIKKQQTSSCLILIGLAIFIMMGACQKETSSTYIYPKDYLPAYPGSYWDYSNGERSSVDPEYQLHNYETSVSSSVKSSTVYVPKVDGQYLYEYSITQNSTVYPIKKLLEETVSTKPWVVNVVNGENIYRQTIKVGDSLIVKYPDKDSLFRQVIVVVEFIDSLTVDRWSVKEYYAKNVGLIRRDINNPWDDKDPVTEKEIRSYCIHKE